MGDDGSCNVRVVVRFRPINERELKEGESRNFSVAIHNSCQVELSGNPPLTFDRAFPPGSPQVRPLKPRPISSS